MGIYYPKEGDLIIFRGVDHLDAEGNIKISAGPHNHIGIVVDERYPTIYAVEGNAGSTYVGNNLIGEVGSKHYDLTVTSDYIRVMRFCLNGGTSRGVAPSDSEQGSGKGR